MRTTKKKTITREETVTDKITCDLCGREIASNVGTIFAQPDSDRWEVSVERVAADPDGGGEREAYDICNDCWPKIVTLVGKPPTAKQSW